MRAADGRKFRIGDYVVDTARYRISHGDVTVAVEPKVFDLLVHLIRHRDRVLTREQLFEAVWDGREVSDATLSNHVRSARKALGDSGELQQTIQTVRGRGYQFVAPVIEVVDDAASAVVGPPPAPEPAPALAPAPVTGSPDEPTRRPWRLALSLVAVALLVPVLFFGARFLDAPSEQPEPSRPYILVVPFGVSDNATEYHRTFADQVTREVVDNLRKISGLRTVPHASAFHFRNDKTREHVLESLPGLQFVLDGEVIVAPDGTLRITPRLTDLRRDLDVWSSPFTVRVDNRDFFETPAGIARAVARALKVEILRDEQRALAELPRIPQAYEPYAAGWREMEKFTHESMHRAVEYFDQAIALDPDFIAAYQAKSDALRSIFAYFEPPQELLPVVEASLAAVLERDPDSAEALSSLGLTQVMAWKWREAWQNLNKARALDPTLAQTELGFALYYTALGENEKVKASLAPCRRAGSAEHGTRGLGNLGPVHGRRAAGGPGLGREADAPASGKRVRVLRGGHCGLPARRRGRGGRAAGERRGTVGSGARCADHAGPGLWLCRPEGQGAAAARGGRAGEHLHVPVRDGRGRPHAG